MGYNPNRDSGQVFTRGFVEISKDKIPSELIEEYGFVPSATQRYFAQLVYNVNGGSSSGGSSGSDFTQADREKFNQLITLIPYIDLLIAATGIKMEEIDVPMELTANTLSNETNEIEKIIPIKFSSNGEYSIIEDITNLDSDEKTEFLLNIAGYVSAVECHVWIDKEQNICSDKTERFLPKITFEKPSSQYPYGKSTIYFSKYDWNDIRELPENKRFVRVHYLKLPVQK